jgi:hypothetical protein
MRYIDADALVKRLKHSPLFLGTNMQFKDGVVDLVEKQPTADAVEVRHGWWIDKPTGAYSRMQSWCSACGKHSGVGGIESNRHKPYCPNCGADMRG